MTDHPTSKLKRARALLNEVMRDLSFGDELLLKQVENMMADAQLGITKAQLLIEVMREDRDDDGRTTQ
jgi:hypothetical protein